MPQISRFKRFFSAALLLPTFVHGSRDLGFDDDSDLTHFVSRPDIKAPLLDVKIYDRESVEPGYFFLAPYASINQPWYPPKYYQTCQTGPTIYDQNGDLIWSGACAVRNQNTCDFRTFQDANGTSYLSAILYIYGDDVKGHGVVMDSSYNTIDEIHVPNDMLNMNMHELKMIEDGTRAIHILFRPEYIDTTVLDPEWPAGWVTDLGFRELDLETGEVLFEWWSLDHISIQESKIQVDNSILGPFPKAWNWLHINSVDKNAAGDYIMSARFTDCIYKISGRDGSILWRLGGTNSSFVLDGFNFSRQHDARWMSYDEDHETISFLDNASDDVTTGGETSTISSALVVELDKTTMTARVVKRRTRPDGQLSRLRGNVQNLPGGNTFVGWSDNAFITEYTRDDQVSMEAKFRSKRFVTYRSYKFPFVGSPIDPPDLRAFAFGTSLSTTTTVLYVSWNGATEVASWKFYSNGDSTKAPKLIGSAERSGFETVYQHLGLETSVFAEAIGVDGSVLGRSDGCMVILPPRPLPRIGYEIDGEIHTDSSSSLREVHDQKVLAETRYKTEL